MILGLPTCSPTCTCFLFCVFFAPSNILFRIFLSQEYVHAHIHIQYTCVCVDMCVCVCVYMRIYIFTRIISFWPAFLTLFFFKALVVFDETL